MKSVILNDKKFQQYLTEEEIQTRIHVLAEIINEDYQGQQVEIIVLLKGAFIFAADLVRKLTIQHTIHFATASSYEGMESTGKVEILFDERIDIKEKQVLIIEDIIDTGKTLIDFVNHLSDREPLDISIASLLFKHKKSNFPYPVDYCGFKIDDSFVVGYGMDFNEKGRELVDVYVIAEDGYGEEE